MSDIAELFARDPNECSKTDIEKIVNELRAKQNLWKSGIAMAGSTKPAKAPKASKSGLDIALDIEDLLK